MKARKNPVGKRELRRRAEMLHSVADSSNSAIFSNLLTSRVLLAADTDSFAAAKAPVPDPKIYLAGPLEGIGASLKVADAMMDAAFRLDGVSRIGVESSNRGVGSRSAYAGNGGAESPGVSRWRSWAGYLGGRDDVRRADLYGIDTRYNGAVVGSSYDVTRDATWGVRFSFADIVTELEEIKSRTRTRAYAGGAFAVLRPADRLTFDLEAAYGYYDGNWTRRNAEQPYSSDYGQDSLSGGIRATYDIPLASASRLSPFAGVRYHYIKQEAFAEKSGNESGNSYDDVKGDSFTTTVGATLAREFSLDGGRSFTPSLEASWKREWADRNYVTAGYVNGSPAAFTLSSIKHRRTSFQAGFNLKATVFRRPNAVVDVEAGYKVKFTKKEIQQDWYAGFTVKF